MKNTGNRKFRKYITVTVSILLSLAAMTGLICSAVYLEGVIRERKQEVLCEAQPELPCAEHAEWVESVDHQEVRQMLKDRAEAFRGLFQSSVSERIDLVLTQPEAVRELAGKAYSSYVQILCRRNLLISGMAGAIRSVAGSLNI
ncbi:MAG: hypothetical protein Q4B85_08765 [Lachnospiraceae bacterium]|nr:hypothetical protein [Lachnospiraceae bacterium]